MVLSPREEMPIRPLMVVIELMAALVPIRASDSNTCEGQERVIEMVVDRAADRL